MSPGLRVVARELFNGAQYVLPLVLILLALIDVTESPKGAVDIDMPKVAENTDDNSGYVPRSLSREMSERCFDRLRFRGPGIIESR